MSLPKKTFVKSLYKCENHVLQVLEGLGLSQAAAWMARPGPRPGLWLRSPLGPWDGSSSPSRPGAWSPGFHADQRVDPGLAPGPVRGIRGPPSSTSRQSGHRAVAHGARQSLPSGSSRGCGPRVFPGKCWALSSLPRAEGPCSFLHVSPASLLTGGHSRGTQVLAPRPSARNALGTQGSTFVTITVNQRARARSSGKVTSQCARLVSVSTGRWPPSRGQSTFPTGPP